MNFASLLRKPRQILQPIATVAEVHEMFTSAAENTLKKAQAILDAAQPVHDLADQLENLGFTKLPSVQQAAEQARLKEDANFQLALINRYRQWYPQNSFVTEEQVEQICRRYGLVMGEASSFIGDMPEKNQRELVAFKCLPEDKQYRVGWSLYSPNGYPSSYKQWLEEQKRLEVEYPQIGIPTTMGLMQATHSQQSDTKPINTFNVVAKLDQFKMERNTIVQSDYRLVDADPIVLFPVLGGYLVVTAWGDESKDVASPVAN